MITLDRRNLPKIRMERQARGWTQRELANAAQTSQQNIQRAEKGRDTTVRLAIRIARAMNLTVEDLWRP